MFLAIPDTIYIPMGYIYGVAAVIVAVALFFSFKNRKKNAPEAEVAEAQAVVAAEPAVALAPGSAGKLKLYDTPPKTAAMVMAIVADKLGKPINELRFVSIKEVK